MQSTHFTETANTSRYRRRLLREAGPGILFIVIGVGVIGPMIIDGIAPQNHIGLLLSVVGLAIGILYALPYFIDIWVSNIFVVTGIITHIDDRSHIFSGITIPASRYVLYVGKLRLTVSNKIFLEHLVEGNVYKISYAPHTRLVLLIEPVPNTSQ